LIGCFTLDTGGGEIVLAGVDLEGVVVAGVVVVFGDVEGNTVGDGLVVAGAGVELVVVVVCGGGEVTTGVATVDAGVPLQVRVVTIEVDGLDDDVGQESAWLATKSPAPTTAKITKKATITRSCDNPNSFSFLYFIFIFKLYNNYSLSLDYVNFVI